MNLNQDSLVALAMLLGGDYTEGVKGVGIVNGMEVLKAFDVAQNCQAGLERFRKWLDGFDPSDLAKNHFDKENPGEGMRSEKEQLFHRKHHTARTRWIAPKHFPDAKVLNAYMNPVVDTSEERFSWGVPDLDGLVAFCHGHMGWVADETKRLISPIIQRMEAGTLRQTRIDSFMRYEDGIKFAKIQSKRLRQVLGLSPLESLKRQKQKRLGTTKAPTLLSEQQEASGGGSFDEMDDDDDSFGERGDDFFAAMDIPSNPNLAWDEQTSSKLRMQTAEDSKPPAKKYHGKKTRSLAILSSTSASTTAIAISSKSDAIPEKITGGGLFPTARRRTNANLPKKAPPAYQKQSSAILEEQNDLETPVHGKQVNSDKTYEVINPSMI